LKRPRQGISFDDALEELEEEMKAKSESTSFATAYRLSGEAKLSGSVEFIDTLLEAGAKFLLFAHHQAVLDTYEDHFKKKKVGYIRIDGRVNPERRHERVT